MFVIKYAKKIILKLTQTPGVSFTNIRLLCLLTVLVCNPAINFTKILWEAFVLIFFCQKLQSQNVSGEKLHKKTFLHKAAHKMLVKITQTPGDNFINILHASFLPKKDWQLDCIFALWGFALVKVSCKRLLKLIQTPGGRDEPLSVI